MARNWRELRAELVAAGKVDEQAAAETTERMRAIHRAARLKEIRETAGLNQTQLAAALHITQPRVSRIERGDIDIAQVRTLRAYVEALGGTFEVVAKFGDTQIVLDASQREANH